MKTLKSVVFSMIAVLILVSGVLVCKHTTKKNTANEFNVADLKTDEQKKDDEYKLQLTQELHRQHMRDVHEFHTFRYQNARSSVKDPGSVAKKKSEILVQVECIEGFKWIIFTKIYNKNMIVDVEQIIGEDGPISCK